PQAIWLIRLGLGKGKTLEEIQSISQFVLEDSQIINEERKWESLESLKIVELAEQQSCVEHGHGRRWNAPNYQVEDVVYIDMKEYYLASIRVAVNGESPQNDIIEFAQAKGWTPIVLLRYLLEAGILESVTIEEAIISLTKQTKVWLPKNQDISCAIIEKFTQGNKVEEKRLTHRVVIDEGELDFLIQDCIKEGTYTVVRIATDSIYIQREALYKIENVSAFFKQVKQKISYPKDSVNTKSVKIFQKTKMPLAVEEYFPCSKHKPFVCHDCFWDWYAHKGFGRVIPDKKPSSNTREKIHSPDPNVVYWPKNRHWKLIKDITESTVPSIHDPITRSQVSYLNGDGGSGKTTRAIRIFKDINMVVFTHTNVLLKTFKMTV
ncbi:10653_t:CDS:2, partial [Racocetra persica]